MHDVKITAVLRYRDPARAAEWLCDAFGFRIENVCENPPGSIDYISLGYGRSVLLICPTVGNSEDTGTDRDDRQQSQSCYLTVEDIREHFATATARGARIQLSPEDQGANPAFYVCQDLEGHQWSFGTHDFAPTEGTGDAAEPAPTPPVTEQAVIPARERRRPALGMLAATAVLASGLTAGAFLLLVGRSDTVATSMAVGVVESRASVDAGGGATLKHLRTEISGLQREREDLVSALKRAEDERKAAEADRAEKDKSLARAMDEITSARSAEASARTDGEAAERRIAALSKELTHERASLNRERLGKKEIEASLQSAIADRDAAQVDVKRLSDAIEALKHSSAQALSRASEAVTGERQVLNEKLAALSEELAELTSDLESERAARARSEAALGAARTEQARIEASLSETIVARDVARADALRLTAALEELRQSHRAALDRVKIDDEDRSASFSTLESAVARSADELAGARAEAAALKTTVDTLKARVAALERAEQDTAGKLKRTTDSLNLANAALAEAEDRHRQDIAEKSKLIGTLSAQLKARSSLPAKPKKVRDTVKPKVSTSNVAKATAPPVEPANADASTDDFVFEDDAAAMEPSRVRRCARFNYSHC